MAIGCGPYGYGIAGFQIGSGLARVNQHRHLPSPMMKRNQQNSIPDRLSPESTRIASDAMTPGYLFKHWLHGSVASSGEPGIKGDNELCVSESATPRQCQTV
ncbi:hypothetical protein L345_01623, partial [Ophiophagus hannah]